jgi:hypothetical protein
MVEHQKQVVDSVLDSSSRMNGDSPKPIIGEEIETSNSTIKDMAVEMLLELQGLLVSPSPLLQSAVHIDNEDVVPTQQLESETIIVQQHEGEVVQNKAQPSVSSLATELNSNQVGITQDNIREQPGLSAQTHAVDPPVSTLPSPQPQQQLAIEVGALESITAEPLESNAECTHTSSQLSTMEQVGGATTTPQTSENQTENQTAPVAILPDLGLENFIESISLPVPQPLLQLELDAFVANTPSTSNMHRSTPCSSQRQSTRLAKKAELNAGKDAIQIAQDLLVKKLGEMPTVEAEPQQIETDFDFYAQHFERPINKPKMEAIKQLIEHGTKKQKKTNTQSAGALDARVKA